MYVRNVNQSLDAESGVLSDLSIVPSNHGINIKEIEITRINNMAPYINPHTKYIEIFCLP